MHLARSFSGKGQSEGMCAGRRGSRRGAEALGGCNTGMGAVGGGGEAGDGELRGRGSPAEPHLGCAWQRRGGL